MNATPARRVLLTGARARQSQKQARQAQRMASPVPLSDQIVDRVIRHQHEQQQQSGEASC